MPTGDDARQPGPDPEDEAPPTRSVSGARGSVLGAAMLGLGQVLEPERTKVIIEQASDDPFDGDDDLDLDFDAVPPRDDG